MKDAMVQCINVSFKYIKNTEEGKTEEKYAVKDVNLEVKKGEFLVVLGHNGSGKSTIAKHMNALVIPTEGTVLVDGIDTKDPERIWDVRAKAGMVFQNPDNQFIGATVRDDIAFGLENHQVDPKDMDGQQRDRQTKKGCQKNRPDFGGIAGHRIFDEFADVVENASSFAYSADDGGKIVVQ